MQTNSAHIGITNRDCRYFEGFYCLDVIEKYQLFNGVAINIFVVACCHITSKQYLSELLDFMTKEQFDNFIKMIKKVQLLTPERPIVEESQNVIMSICQSYNEHFSAVMTLSELSNINFSDGLNNKIYSAKLLSNNRKVH